MMSTKSDPQLFTLEEHLADALKPITPPRELVLRLRDRIRLPQPGEIVSRFSDWRRLFIIYGAVMSGLLVTITVARAFFYFFGKRDL